MCKRYWLCLILLSVQTFILAMEPADSKPNSMQEGMIKSLIAYIKSGPEVNKTVMHLRRIKRSKQSQLLSQQVVETQDESGDTLIHALAKLGTPGLFSTGLQLGISPDIKNNDQHTARDILLSHVTSTWHSTDKERLSGYLNCLEFYRLTYKEPLKKVVEMDESI